MTESSLVSLRAFAVVAAEDVLEGTIVLTIAGDGVNTAGVVTLLALFIAVAVDFRIANEGRRSGIALALRDFGVLALPMPDGITTDNAGVPGVESAGDAFAIRDGAGLAAVDGMFWLLELPIWARRLAPRVVGASIGGNVMTRPSLRTIVIGSLAGVAVAAEIAVV